MMDEEDKKPVIARVGRPDLGPLSIGDLNDYIAELEGEIARVRDDIARKQKHRAGLDSLFKT